MQLALLSNQLLSNQMPRIDSASWPAWLLFYLMPWFLLVDSISGGLQQLPGALLWSLMYKALLLSVLLWQLILWRSKALVLLLGLLLLALSGPLYSYLTLAALQNVGAAGFLATELPLLIKALAPLLAFSFFCHFCLRYPAAFVVMIDRLMLLSFGVIVVNLLLGLAGFGYTAYQPMDNVVQPFLGLKGFFYSTNELAAVLLVVSGWLLWRSWPLHKARYGLISLLTIASALLLLTKTGLLGSLMLVFAIPLLSAKAGFYRQYRRQIAVALLLALSGLLVLIWQAEALLRAAGLYDKLAYAFQQRGVLGIVLSSRDLYLSVVWQQTEQHYALLHRLFGVGVAGVSVLLKKYFIEIDLFDLMVFYGVAGAAIFGLTFGQFFYSSFRQLSKHPLAATLLFINVLLLGVAMLAGHILTSGMLWLPWALLNAAVFNTLLITAMPVTTPAIPRGTDERSA
ncbi:O-antigen ligase family protein [Arsukibacterium sp. MJ3]|uniref:O-antigen ligase family protein n=1 Tax=Arsukibacterium sp. MJ3 TaxID=1632859 RepID=UPI00069A131D|nr:O-antigen ligase family protein [Arsukibacterium sp. MJ3]